MTRRTRRIYRSRDAGLDKKALHKTIDANLSAQAKRKLRQLHAELSAARQHEKKSCGLARMKARARIASLRERAKRIKIALRSAIERERRARNEACAARPRVASARKAWQEERAYQASLKRSAASTKARARPGLRRTRGERRSESDDEVRHNLPAHLHSLWRRVKKSIHATPRMSRTEAFLKYVEEHPREEFADADDLTDTLVRDLERQQRARRRDARIRRFR